jgi:hypothetical protein
VTGIAQYVDALSRYRLRHGDCLSFLYPTKYKKLVVYHDNGVRVPTFKTGVFVTPDKQIQLATVERQTKAYHKFERMIAHTREH